MSCGLGKTQQEAFSEADNRSGVTKCGHLPAGSPHATSQSLQLLKCDILLIAYVVFLVKNSHHALDNTNERPPSWIHRNNSAD